MFQKRFDNDLSPTRQELRDFFADRLRLAFDFATLGAYELTEAGEDPAATDAEPRPAEHIKPRPTEGVERTACTSDGRLRHVGPANVPCPVPADARRPPERCDGGGRRAGSVATAEQPCTWTG
jgi:hypothetical protein